MFKESAEGKQVRERPTNQQHFPKHLPTLHASDRMKDAFSEPPLVAYRRDANLEDILVHKKQQNVLLEAEQKWTMRRAEMCDLPVQDRGRLVRGRGQQQVHHEEQCWL